MKKLISIISLALTIICANAGKIVTDSINSKVLKTWVKYNVYLPDSYARGEKQYPVLYLLHGLKATYETW